MTVIIDHHLPANLMVIAFVRNQEDFNLKPVIEFEFALDVFQKHTLISGLRASFGLEILCPFSQGRSVHPGMQDLESW